MSADDARDSFRQRAILLAQHVGAPQALTAVGTPARARARMPLSSSPHTTAHNNNLVNTPLSITTSPGVSTVRRPPPPPPMSHQHHNEWTDNTANAAPSDASHRHHRMPAAAADISHSSGVLVRLQDQLDAMLQRDMSRAATTSASTRLEVTRTFLSSSSANNVPPTSSSSSHHLQHHISSSTATPSAFGSRQRAVVNPRHNLSPQRSAIGGRSTSGGHATAGYSVGVPQTAVPGGGGYLHDGHIAYNISHHAQPSHHTTGADVPMLRLGGGPTGSSESMTFHIQTTAQHPSYPNRSLSSSLTHEAIAVSAPGEVGNRVPQGLNTPPPRQRGESLPLLSPESPDDQSFDASRGALSHTAAPTTHTIHVRQPPVYDTARVGGGSDVGLVRDASTHGRSVSGTSLPGGSGSVDGTATLFRDPYSTTSFRGGTAQPLTAAAEQPPSLSAAPAAVASGASRVVMAVSQRILDLEAAVTALQTTLVRRHTTVSVEVDKSKRVVDHAEYRLTELSGNIDASTSSLTERLESRIKTQAQLRDNQSDQWRSAMLNSVRGIPAEVRREAANAASGGTAATVSDIRIQVDALMTGLDQYKTQNELRTTTMLHKFMDLQRKVRDRIAAVRVASNAAVSSTVPLSLPLPTGEARVGPNGNGLNQSHHHGSGVVDVSPLRVRLGLLSTSPEANHALVPPSQGSRKLGYHHHTAATVTATKSMQSMSKMLYQFVQQTRSQLDELRRDRRAFEEHFIARVAAMNNGASSHSV